MKRDAVTEQLWHEVKGADRASKLKSTVDSLASAQEGRRNRALKNIQLYESRRLGDLSPASYLDSATVDYLFDDDSQTMRCNLTRSLVNTAVAKIAGKQKPKTQFCVSDADWSQKRRAKRMEKAVEAVMLSRQNGQHDGYEVGILCLRDSCVCDCGVLGFSAEHEQARVVIERVPPWEILVDPNEGRTGAPLNMFRLRPYDKYKLAAQFPDFRDDIMSAPKIGDADPVMARSLSLQSSDRQVKVYEGWRLPCGKDKKGAHAIVVGSVDVTGGESWERATFPFEFFVWEPWMLGMFGTSLVDNARDLAREFNAHFERWSAAEKLASNIMCAYEEGSVERADLEDNSPVVLIPVRKGSGFMPTFSTPQTMGPSSVQWGAFLKSLTFEVPGVGQMGATGQKAPDVTASVAMRTIQDIETERFAIQWQQYERVMAVGAARQIIECLKEIAQGGKSDVTLRLGRSGALNEINWKDASIDLPDEAIQVYAVSGLVDTPYDRLALAERMVNAGMIGKAGYFSVLKDKDIDAVLNQGNEQSALVERYIERWLDAAEDDSAEDVRKAAQPPSALKWMAVEEAIIQVGRAYMRAELDEAPDYNLGFFLRFLEACDAEVQRRQEAQAKLQAMAAGRAAPPGAPGPAQQAGPAPLAAVPSQGAAA